MHTHNPPLVPYRAPRLKTYGSVTELTRKNGGTVGMNDGGNGPDKTAFAP